tara:strand:+ start:142 stop:1560 length:1419 start_codon:yes stop_codon:yes gene_type:complete
MYKIFDAMKPILTFFIKVIVLSQSVFAQDIDSSTYVRLFLPDGCVNATVMLQNYSVDSVPNFNPSICSQSSAPFQFDLLASDQDYIVSIIGHDTIHINYTINSYSPAEDDVTLIEEGSIYQVLDTVILAGDTIINTITNADSIGSHFFIEYTDLYIISPTDPTDPSGELTDSMYTELIFPDGCTNATIYLSYLNEDSVLIINPVQCPQSSTPFVLSELSLDQEFVLNIIANDTININYSLNLHSPISTMNLEEGAIYQIFDSITTEGNTSINVFSNIDTIGPNIVVNYSDLFVLDSIIDSFPWVSLPGCLACSDEVNNTLLQYLSDTEMDTSQVVLILEQKGIDISITDSNGTEFVPTVMDSFIVFSPFNLEDQYTIIVDQSEISLEWLILLSDGSTISEGEISSIDSTINNGMFTIIASLSIEENTKPLEVYNTTYFNLLGKEVKTLDQGLYIKVMQTNKGQIAEKVYFRD